jgi:uncharacterized protein YceH (UPF0502 family)
METNPQADPEPTPGSGAAPAEAPFALAALDDVEARVLGCLIEKELTTPEYYPLTLKALTAACNQQSNRHPVVTLDETAVVRGLEGLQRKGLSATTHQAGARVPKYRHLFTKKVPIRPAELAVLCELLLRGPQTGGELKGRAARMHPFASLEEVEEALARMAERKPPLVTLLERMPGQKERRWAHLLAGEPVYTEAPVTSGPAPERATLKVREEEERIARLEARVAALEAALEAFRKQFE